MCLTAELSGTRPGELCRSLGALTHPWRETTVVSDWNGKKPCGSNICREEQFWFSALPRWVFLGFKKDLVCPATFVSRKLVVVSKFQNWPVHFFIFLCQRVDVEDEYRRPLLHNLILIICVALTAAAVQIQACSMTFLKAVAKISPFELGLGLK